MEPCYIFFFLENKIEKNLLRASLLIKKEAYLAKWLIKVRGPVERLSWYQPKTLLKLHSY